MPTILVMPSSFNTAAPKSEIQLTQSLTKVKLTIAVVLARPLFEMIIQTVLPLFQNEQVAQQ